MSSPHSVSNVVTNVALANGTKTLKSKRLLHIECTRCRSDAEYSTLYSGAQQQIDPRSDVVAETVDMERADIVEWTS